MFPQMTGSDRLQAARHAAVNAWNLLTILPLIPAGSDLSAIESLASDIVPYSHTFRVVRTGASVRILASDDGCVNQGNTLAEAWIQYDSARDEYYFYWES